MPVSVMEIVVVIITGTTVDVTTLAPLPYFLLSYISQLDSAPFMIGHGLRPEALNMISYTKNYKENRCTMFSPLLVVYTTQLRIADIINSMSYGVNQ